MTITNITPIREQIPSCEEENKVYDHLTLYDQDNKAIQRSVNADADSVIELEYEQLTFVSIPNQPIFITFESLLSVINSKKQRKK